MQSARRSHRMHETMCHQRQAKPKLGTSSDQKLILGSRPTHSSTFITIHWKVHQMQRTTGRMITLQYANSNTQRLQKQNANDLCDIQSRETNWLSNTLGRPSDTYFTCQRIDKATTWFSRVDNIWQKVQCYHILSDCHHTPDVHSFNCLFPFIDHI